MTPASMTTVAMSYILSNRNNIHKDFKNTRMYRSVPLLSNDNYLHLTSRQYTKGIENMSEQRPPGHSLCPMLTSSLVKTGPDLFVKQNLYA